MVKRKDEEPSKIAEEVGKTIRSGVKDGQIGNFTVKNTIEIKGLLFVFKSRKV